MKDKKRIIGICCIIAAAVIVTFGFLSQFGAKDNGTNSPGRTNLDAADEIEEPSGTDSEDIDVDEADDKMKLKFEIPSEVKERIPNLETLESKTKEFLIEQDFYEDVSRVIGRNVITEDFDKNLLMLTFTLNDKVRTTLTLTIDKDDNKYEFNYY